jgi:hypothetical protein
MASPFAAYEAPQDGAPLCPNYPQFVRVPVPPNSRAKSAWKGTIQPFDSDASARAFLRDAEADRTIWVGGGSIRPSRACERHWANPLLVNMAVECEVLVLLREPPAHPCSHLLKPRFGDHYSYPGIHPHPRHDQRIELDGAGVPGLCVYSAPEVEFDPEIDPLSQYLDQLTIYVGKHLIWLRTRQQYLAARPHDILVRSLQPGEELNNDEPALAAPATNGKPPRWLYWRGYWPGRSATGFNPRTHLETIGPDQECWCGSGVEYGACHRPKELEIVNG